MTGRHSDFRDRIWVIGTKNIYMMVGMRLCLITFPHAKGLESPSSLTKCLWNEEKDMHWLLKTEWDWPRRWGTSIPAKGSCSKKQTTNKQNPFFFGYRTRGLMWLNEAGEEEVRSDKGTQSGEGAAWGILQVKGRLEHWWQSGQEDIVDGARQFRATPGLWQFGGYTGSAFCQLEQLESSETEREGTALSAWEGKWIGNCSPL